jgi:hypothetical protein
MLRTVFIFLLVALAAGGIYVAVISSNKQSAMKEEYVVTDLSGDVTVLSKEKPERKAGKYDILRPDDVIKTTDKARVDIMFKRGKAVRLKDNSTLKMETGAKDAAPRVTLMKGTVLAKIAKAGGDVPKGSNVFTVATPHAVAGVRGTVFSVSVNDKAASDASAETKVAVLEGTVKVKAVSTSGETDVTNGTKTYVSRLTRTPELTPLTAKDKESFRELDSVITAETSFGDTFAKTLKTSIDAGLCSVATNITRIKMKNVESSILEYGLGNDDKVPASLEELKAGGTKGFMDACGVPYRYTVTGPYTAELRSAGADMRMDTDDDIVRKIHSAWKADWTPIIK